MKIKQGMETEYAKYKDMNSKDSYSKGVIDFGEKWAELMESEISKGNTIKECGDRTTQEADTDGITGYMFGAAVSGLSKFWEHGDALRAWHNRQYVSEEKAAEADKTGGVVNPAIVTIG